MANTSKVYTISIQTDAAQQEVEATRKKIAALDAQLEGLDRNSGKAKAIVAEMGQLARQAEGAEAAITDLNARMDALKPGSVGALRAEVEELERAFEGAVIGTKEQEEALLRLGRAKGTLKELEDAVDALDPKMKAAAFVDFANGVVGAFGIATTAAQTFGLSSDTAKEYEAKLLSLITVLSSVEQISRAVNSETLSVVKSALASGKAWLTAGESASTGAKITKAALISTGIGVILVLIGTLIGSWDRLTSSVKGSAQFFEKVRAVASGLFDAGIASLKVYLGLMADLFTGNIPQLIVDARSAGKKIGDAYTKGFQDSMFEGYKKIIQQQVDYNEQILKVQEASGRDTYALQRRILQDRIVLAKDGNAEEKKAKLELIGDLAALDRAEQVRRKKEALEAAQARLDAVASLEAAKGNDAFQKQLTAAKNRLATLQAAAQPNAAAITAAQSAIDTLTATHDQQVADKRRAALLARQQAEVELEEIQGKYTLDLRVKQAQELLAQDTGSSEKAREQKKADNAALNKLLAEQVQFEKDLKQQNFEQDEAQRGAAIDINNAFKTSVEETGKAIVQNNEELQKRINGDLGRTILTKLFGVKPEDVDAVKQALTQSVAEVYTNLQGLASAYLDGSLQAADQQIQAAQDLLTKLDTELQAAQSAAESAEQKAAESSGARRDYYLTQLSKERAEVQRVASAKAKAARDEETATKEKHRLEKISQEMAAATALATNIAAAASAVYAGIKAVEKGSEVPFPANIFAIASGIAAVIAAVSSAKQLATATKYADGTGALGPDGVLRGPRHSGGGIDLWGPTGVYYGNAEGGEAITPVDASRHNANALALIRTKGRTRTLTAADFLAHEAGATRVLPAPAGAAGHYASGTGALGGGMPAGGAASVAELAALRAEQARTNELLAQLLGHAASTDATNQQIAQQGPAPLVFGPEEALKAEQQRQAATNAAAAVTVR